MLLFLNLYVFIALIILSLIVHLFIKSYDKRLLLISIFSIIVLSTFHIAFLGICIGVILLLYLLTLKVEKKSLSLGKFTLIGLIIIFLVLIIGKYGNKIIDKIYSDSEINIIVPLGISYFVMKIIQFVIDFRRGIIKSVRLLDIIGYIVFLPTFAAGPIENYNSFKEAYIEDYSTDDYAYGLKRIVIGLIKKLVITDVILFIYVIPNLSKLSNYPLLANLLPLITAITTFVNAYFDLSAYTDIAIGFSVLLGFKVRENFNRPFWKRNISQFWRSWHISLSNWCTSNVYFPVFGATRKVWIGMYASMLTMALWHNVSFNWVAWGLHHASGLVFYSAFDRYVRKHKKLKKFFKTKTVKFLSHIITFIFVSFGYAFVANKSFVVGLIAYKDAVLAIPYLIYDLIKMIIF